MKSAYELAMERLEKKAPSTKLTDKQKADIAEIDSKLGNFAGRITRDNWVDQAKLLASGDIAGFEKKYGALGSEVKG